MKGKTKYEPITATEFNYDDRKRILIATMTYVNEETNVKSIVENTYSGDESVKKFLEGNKTNKISSKKTIEEAEKLVQDCKDKEANLKKGLKTLTPKQEELIEELRVIGTYQDYDGAKQNTIVKSEQLEDMKDRAKKGNAQYEDLKKACKAVDFKFD